MKSDPKYLYKQNLNIFLLYLRARVDHAAYLVLMAHFTNYELEVQCYPCGHTGCGSHSYALHAGILAPDPVFFTVFFYVSVEFILKCLRYCHFTKVLFFKEIAIF